MKSLLINSRFLNLTIGILLTILTVIVVAIGGTGCMRHDYLPPQATFILEPAPLEVEATSLYKAWVIEPQEVADEFSRLKLYFRVTVEKLSDLGQKHERFVQAGNVRFMLEEPGYLEKIKVNDRVDIVGKLSGMQDGVLIISDCWIRVVTVEKKQGY
jgi:hypothetical protein